ncbi:hypothetical protein ZWY2020_020373 [Hordeum vulgare]|nr:hypothetical protein ZWY2020_020373 [Hordeum vulgare]
MLFSIAVEPWISVEEALIDLGRFAFRRPLGPMDAIAWQDLLECIALHEPNVERSIGCLSWRLEPSGCFSTKSLYRAIAPSPGTEPLTALSEIRLPLKNRIFLWQWLRGCLPSGVEVIKRNKPGDGICPLYATEEDSNHIFFFCVFAQFLWSCFREVVGGTWCHTNLPHLFIELQASPPSVRHTKCLTVGVLACTLWTVRNKLVIQGVPLRRATDAVIKMYGYLQLWRSLSRSQDRDAINIIISRLRVMSLPPPPEPD